jgi:hypothetical protein
VSSSADVTVHFHDPIDIEPLDVELTGIPNDYHIDLSGIPDDFSLDIRNIPRIEIAPLEVSLAITRIPSIRTHIPSNYTVGLSILGYELVALRLCGETQLITEPFRPNPCEICGQIHREPGDVTHLGTVGTVVQPKAEPPK